MGENLWGITAAGSKLFLSNYLAPAFRTTNTNRKFLTSHLNHALGIRAIDCSVLRAENPQALEKAHLG